jgi:DNA-binding NarL/FixJ family response regulator
MARESYAQALNHHAGLRVVACAATLEETLQAIQTKTIDVALIASELADGSMSGLLAIFQINKTHPKVKTVLLFEPSADHLIVPAFRAGARGVFCPAADGIRKLCRCVKRIHEGQVWATSAQIIQMLEAFPASAPQHVVDANGVGLLTKREEDVVRLVKGGLTNRKIAHELNLSEHTIANNLFRIFDKLGVSSRVELVLYGTNASAGGVDAPSNDRLPKKDFHKRANRQLASHN